MRRPGPAPAGKAKAKPAKSARKGTAAAAAKPRRLYLPAQERRRRIIEAAQKVFARTSLAGARTRDLARAAEVNQATLFEHFASKEDLFVAAVVQPLADLMQGMRERASAYEAAASTDDMLGMAEVVSRQHLETMVGIYPLLVSALFSDPELGKKLYREQIVPLIQARADATRSLIRKEIDPELVNLVIFGAFFAIAMDKAFTGKSDDLAGVAHQLTDLMVSGFLKDGKKKQRVRRAKGGKNAHKAE